MYQDYDSSFTITWFADTDRNPYNNGSKQLPDPQNAGATSSFFVPGNYEGSTASLDSTYRYIYAKVADSNNHARYGYLSTPITISPAPPVDITRPIANLADPAVGSSIQQSAINSRGWLQVSYLDAGGLN